MASNNDDIELVRRALEGTRADRAGLVRRIQPGIHAEIACLLMRMAPVRGRNPRQELEDLVQEAFLKLFDRDRRPLAGWDPARGCTLDSYVRLIARNRALDVLRSRRRTPWQNDGPETEEIEHTGESLPDPEDIVLARETLATLDSQLHELLAPREYSLFVSLYVEELPPVDVAAALGMSAAAVYQWSSRFRRNVLPRLLAALDEPARSQ